MIRRTKIVATLGPSCSDAKTLDRMMEAGLDVVRLNFSHGVAQDHIDRAELVRSLARTRGRAVGVLVDLQGPKIRIGKFKDGKITLAKGDMFILDAACTLGDQTRVGLDYKELPNDVKRASPCCWTTAASSSGSSRSAVRKSSAKWCKAACCPTTRASTARAAVCRRLHSPPKTSRHQDGCCTEGRLPRRVVSALRRRHAPGA